ncbi:unnamed protein product [Orchesella dallaii]|uniref:Uncharacterized protein n=1 Tax=Orchesella dallaii TaxID=48710 RepID=A0ABP1RU89_9HEXA
MGAWLIRPRLIPDTEFFSLESPNIGILNLGFFYYQMTISVAIWSLGLASNRLLPPQSSNRLFHLWYLGVKSPLTTSVVKSTLTPLVSRRQIASYHLGRQIDSSNWPSNRPFTTSLCLASTSLYEVSQSQHF